MASAGPNAERRTMNDVQKKILAGGLALLTRADHKLPFIDLQVACGGGVLFENESNNGISSLMAETMTLGAARRSDHHLISGLGTADFAWHRSRKSTAALGGPAVVLPSEGAAVILLVLGEERPDIGHGREGHEIAQERREDEPPQGDARESQEEGEHVVREEGREADEHQRVEAVLFAKEAVHAREVLLLLEEFRGERLLSLVREPEEEERARHRRDDRVERA